ncbi:hypothetical protein [Rhizobium sp. YTU87027]|uniref:hypothetical protein n=1 Tax=Rhizobium sp. YTU87027 TaxID=3417741 RepID=UPI003D686805
MFNVRVAEWSLNKEDSVRWSRAVGTAQIMLAISLFEAISMADASVADYHALPASISPSRRACIDGH